MKYKNFTAAVYCRAWDLIAIRDFNAFEARFAAAERQVHIGKVYLETYRGGVRVPREQMERCIEFFQKRGIETAGGITATADGHGEGGFHPLCYTSESTRDLMTRVVEETALLFDEVILDDFYFTNCKCAACVKAKGERGWAEFRTELMTEFSKNVLLPAAKRANPNVKVVIKFPNWYEHFAECGYDLNGEPAVFDGIYAGTETRSPAWTQQHLPKYLSYFNLRRLEKVAPGHNGGGWFDPYECTGNLTEYADQGYLTLYAKAKEATLFCLGSLLESSYSLCLPLIGQVFEETDALLPELGNPVGVPCYAPISGRGEDFLPNFIGMLGIPLEPEIDYPADAKTVFLTAGAASDPDIIEKIQASLINGADVIVTSGFTAACPAFRRSLADVRNTGKKASVQRYCLSTDGGISFGNYAEGADPVLLPQLEFPTNDVWSLAGGMDGDNNFPLLLKTSFGNGTLYLLAVPENPAQFYLYPARVLDLLRGVFCRNLPVCLTGAKKAALFCYDNGRVIVRSFAPYPEEISLALKGGAGLEEIQTGRILPPCLTENGRSVRFPSLPGVSLSFRVLTEKT